MKWVTVDYADKSQLTQVLTGVHTVICFGAAHLDPGSIAQKALIDAAIAAGVKRYAPNEWSGLVNSLNQKFIFLIWTNLAK